MSFVMLSDYENYLKSVSSSGHICLGFGTRNFKLITHILGKFMKPRNIYYCNSGLGLMAA